MSEETRNVDDWVRTKCSIYGNEFEASGDGKTVHEWLRMFIDFITPKPPPPVALPELKPAVTRRHKKSVEWVHFWPHCTTGACCCPAGWPQTKKYNALLTAAGSTQP